MTNLMRRLRRVVNEVGWPWLITAILAGWLFLQLADDAPEGDFLHWEEPVIRASRGADDTSAASTRVIQASCAITSLGSWPVLFATGTLSVAWLYFRGDRRRAGLLVGLLLGGLVLGEILKRSFNRDRPSIVVPLVEEDSPSFPSGHALNATIGYLALATVLSRRLRRKGRRWMIGLALSVSALVGLSRVHLGVHYPTDVLAGWSLGLCLFPVIGAIASWFDVRPAINPAGTDWPDDFNYDGDRVDAPGS